MFKKIIQTMIIIVILLTMSLFLLNKLFKINYVVKGRQGMLDICYDHGTHTCNNFFDLMLYRNIISDKERESIEIEDHNNPGHPHNPDYSIEALALRKDVLNRYFDYVREQAGKDKELLDNIECIGIFCKAKNGYIERDYLKLEKCNPDRDPIFSVDCVK